MKKTYISIFVIAAACAVLACYSGQASEAELLQQAPQSYELILNTQGDVESTEEIRFQKLTFSKRKCAKSGRCFEASHKNHAACNREFCKGLCKNTHQKQCRFTNAVQETTISGVIAHHVFYTVDLGRDSVNRSEVI